MRALVALALLLTLAMVGHERTERTERRATSRRAATTRFGGVSVARRLRPQGTPLVLGRFATGRWRPTPLLVAARAPGSVLVVGPTQSGKTTRLCAPVVCAWDGPVLAASVKGDLVVATSASRGALGRVQVVAPELDAASVFDPVVLARTPAAARGLARDLTAATGAGQATGDQEFWSSLSAKLLAPLLLAAHHGGGSIATVQSWVDRRDLDTPLALLDEVSADALVASFSRDDRTLGSVLATVEAAIESLRTGDDVVHPAQLLSGANTLYLSAPLHDQRRFRPMFTGLLRQVLAEAATLAERGAPCRLLLLLDEAASIAPLEELDQVAATCQGQGVTLVTVWQDLAQLVARYGPKARTVVNNHTTRVLLGGLADPTLAEWLPTLTGPARVTRGDRGPALAPEELRQWPRGAAVVVTGREPPVRMLLGTGRSGRRRRRSLRFATWRTSTPRTRAG
jgi:type IV secretory pathway TraG/TraD family ATPase VirD4